MAKSKKGLFLVAALGALGIGAASYLKNPGQTVTGKSGKVWRMVHLGLSGTTHTYEVFAPKGSFGPHPELSVLRFSRVGDESTGKITGVGSGVPQVMVETAAADFSLPFNASLMPSAV